jgi:hypothetical protein
MEDKGGVMTYQEWIKNFEPDPCNWGKTIKEAWKAADRNAREECAKIVVDRPSLESEELAEAIRGTINDG